MMIGTLVVTSLRKTLFESKAAHNRTWQAFLKSGTNHSADANTLPEVMNRCEREGIAYTLIATPGMGYYIKPYQKGPTHGA